MIAAADRRPDYYRQDGYAAPSFARRGSAGSEESRRGSLSSVPGLSPLSTAHTSPIISPTTPPASFSIPTKSQLQICLRLADYRDDQERQRRKLTQIRSRRTPSRHSFYGELDTQQHLGHTHSPNRAVHLYQHRHHHQQRRQSPVITTVPPIPSLPISTSSSSSSSSTTTTTTATIEDARERKPHFNQKYKDPDKLFIVYYKEDQRWSWPAIVARRLQMLKDVLGPGYNPRVEEHRNVSGLNGMYYRQNELMSVLTPDGSGLVFAEKDGRWWELAKSQKCRAAAPDSNNPAAASAGVRRGSGAGTAADTRPRGMVERYPEEVVHYWDPYVIKFIPKEKQAEVLARARRYCKLYPSGQEEKRTNHDPIHPGEIRAEQRRQHGVPPWSLDNREDRVLTIKEPKKDGPSNDDSTAANNDNSSPSTCRGRNARRSRRS